MNWVSTGGFQFPVDALVEAPAETGRKFEDAIVGDRIRAILAAT